jgi:RTX calcium-binding nonapeptide repeat (4 copies)
MQREGGCAVIRQRHLIAVVGAFLMGCAVLLIVVGCAGVREQATEEQGHTEAIASEEARCEGTRTYKEKDWEGAVMTTNDLPGCPKGGLLSGTNENDGRPADRSPALYGKDGDDEIHGLGGSDNIIGEGGNDVIYGGAGFDWPLGGVGDDVIYGGDGDDFWLHGGAGEDVLYGGKGNDGLDGDDGSLGPGPPMRDELYCGPGKDQYVADRLDHVDSSCEEKVQTLCCVG